MRTQRNAQANHGAQLAVAAAIMLIVGSTASAKDPPQVGIDAKIVDASDAFQWNIGVDYAHFNPSAGGNGDQWGGSASGFFKFDSKLGLNIDLGYHNVSTAGSGPSLDNWNVGASLVRNMDDGRFGATLAYQRSSISSFSTNATNYGLFVDYYATPAFTLSGKGGGFSISPGSNGTYFGGSLKGYPCPNLAIGGTIDHAHFNGFGGSNETDYGLGAEYQFGGRFSLYGGYSYSDFTPGNFHVATWSVGIKLYDDTNNGSRDLVDRQRTGTTGWSTQFAALALKF